MAEPLSLENLVQTGEAVMFGNSLTRIGRKTINLVILGHQGTGKTSIFRHMHVYFKSRYPDTRRTDNRLEIKNDRARVIIHDMDLPEILNVSCMYSVWSKGDVFVLVYSIDDEASFEYISQIKDFLVRPRNRGPPTITVVGNKSDLHVRAMRYEVADCIVSIDWEVNYLEISAMYDDPDDAIPKILRWLVPRIKKAPLLPVGGEFDTFELRGIQFRPRASTTGVQARYEPVSVHARKSITEDSKLPNKTSRGGAGRRFSLPNILFMRRSSVGAPCDTRIQEEPDCTKTSTCRRPSLISQLLFCVKDSDKDTNEDLDK